MHIFFDMHFFNIYYLCTLFIIPPGISVLLFIAIWPGFSQVQSMLYNIMLCNVKFFEKMEN